MASVSEKVSNFFEIAGNTLTYSIPLLGHYLHYQKLKEIDATAQAIFENKKQQNITQDQLRQQLKPLRQRLDRLQKSETAAFWMKLATWIILWIFVFSSAFTLIGILVDNVILDPYIGGYRDSIVERIRQHAIHEDVAQAMDQADRTWDAKWRGTSCQKQPV